MSDTLLGVLVLSRHGDREGFYQSPTSYTPSGTAITPLGETQEFQLGQVLRARYVDRLALGNPLASESTIHFEADAGGEGTVIFDSALALGQGLFPATGNSNITLSNGTTVVSPLGGYQYIGVKGVLPAESIELEGWTDCQAFTDATNVVYNTSAFQQVGSDNSAFLQSLVPIVGGRSVKFSNFYNVFDYINVQSLHNATFLASVNAQILAQSRDLANYHEYSVFSSPNLGSIGNIAFQPLIQPVMDWMYGFTNSTQPVKFVSYSVSYKPFIAMMKMTNVSDTHPELRGLVNYAAAIALELYQPASGSEPYLVFNFKNGSDVDFSTYPMFGSSGQTTLSEFNSTLSPYGINDLSTWCDRCGNSATRGCDLIAKANTTFSDHEVARGQKVSPLAAGFIGAGVTLAVMTLLFAIAFFFLGLHKKRRNRSLGSPSYVDAKQVS